MNQPLLFVDHYDVYMYMYNTCNITIFIVLLSWQNRTGFTGPNMVYTGKYDSRDTARYLMWNGQFSISGFRTPYATMLNGTEALLFHPGIKCDEHLEVLLGFLSGYFKLSLSMVLKCISSDFHRKNWRKLIKILDSLWMLLMEYWTSPLYTHWVC